MWITVCQDFNTVKVLQWIINIGFFISLGILDMSLPLIDQRCIGQHTQCHVGNICRTHTDWALDPNSPLDTAGHKRAPVSLQNIGGWRHDANYSDRSSTYNSFGLKWKVFQIIHRITTFIIHTKVWPLLTTQLGVLIKADNALWSLSGMEDSVPGQRISVAQLGVIVQHD